MESPAHQEWRARQQVNWRAIMWAALSAGGFLFIISGGTPWGTAGTMNVIMGRDLPLGFFTLLVSHFAMAFVYAAIIGLAIYRLRLLPAVATGLAVSMILYGLNFAIFRGLAIQMQSPETRAFMVHLAFGLIASVVYKGASVPSPFRGSASDVARATHAGGVHWNPRNTDPEPSPAEDERPLRTSH